MNDICAWLAAQSTSCAEFAGSLILLANVYLVTRENIWNWPTAVVGYALYIFVYYRAGLYSDTALQVVYVVLSLYGWYHWLRGGKARNDLPVTKTSLKEALLLLCAALVGWMVMFNITRHLPNVTFPLLDSALVATSLVAQWMMTRKLLESWTVWIAADAVYVWLFNHKDLPLTAILFAVFLALAVLGHVQWKKSYLQNSRALS